MATKIDTTKVMWRVQVRKSRAHKWVNKGLFETRKDAREKCADFRDNWVEVDCRSPNFDSTPIYGFGNTRVIRHVMGQK